MISDALFFGHGAFHAIKSATKVRGREWDIRVKRRTSPRNFSGGGAFFMAVVEKNGNIVRKNRSADEEVRPDAARKLTVRQTA